MNSESLPDPAAPGGVDTGAAGRPGSGWSVYRGQIWRMYSAPSFHSVIA